MSWNRQPMLADARPDLAAQWDGVLNGGPPGKVTLGSSRKVWWRCACGRSWQASVSNRVYRSSGCPACARAATTAPAPGRSLLEVHPRIATEWHPTRNGDLSPGQVAAASSRLVWWACPECGLEWQSRISGRVRAGTRCPVCALRRRRGRTTRSA